MITIVEPETKKRLEAEVYNTIHILAPHFEVSPLSQKWLSPRLPRIRLVDKYPGFKAYGGYQTEENQIYVEKGHENDSMVIPHEVGHWFHRMLNPPLFRIFNKLGRLRVSNYAPPRVVITYASESVALASESLITGNGASNQLNNLGFNLGSLTRMTFKEMISKTGMLEELSTNLHRATFSN